LEYFGYNEISQGDSEWGAFLIFIADFFGTQIIGGAKELVVLL
jgi:hypothetical protein